MVFKENPKQPNTWDCGVYVCMFTKFLCIDEYYNLNGQNLSIYDQQIKEFRDK
jgi:Ulp1 family protease